MEHAMPTLCIDRGTRRGGASSHDVYLFAYLRNMAMPMCVMLRLMVFHDLVMTNTSRSLSGTLMESLSSVRLRRRPSAP